MTKDKKKTEKYQNKGAKMKGGNEKIKSDVNGSYTGTPTDSEDKRPIQDADDL